MAKKTKTQNYPLAENYIHVYEGKVQIVKVCVHINYATGQISLIDPNPENPGSVQGKQWLFKKRELEYMNGWLDILDAMKSAVNEAAEKLRTYQKEQADEKLEMAGKILAEANQ